MACIRKMREVLFHEDRVKEARIHGGSCFRALVMQDQINGLLILFKEKDRLCLFLDKLRSLIKDCVLLKMTNVKTFKLQLGHIYEDSFDSHSV